MRTRPGQPPSVVFVANPAPEHHPEDRMARDASVAGPDCCLLEENGDGDRCDLAGPADRNHRSRRDHQVAGAQEPKGRDVNGDGKIPPPAKHDGKAVAKCLNWWAQQDSNLRPAD